MKRLLDCTASDFFSMNATELKQAIKASEGRTILSEVIAPAPPHYPSVTNLELAGAFGADILLLNLFDVFDPFVAGDVLSGKDLIYQLKKLTGRPIGLNLEPVDKNAKAFETLYELPEGRTASDASLEKVKELGFDIVCLTGNPKTGVSNSQIRDAIQRSKKILGDDVLIIAGKMHSAGVEGEDGSQIVTEDAILQFVEAGADVILLPAPGTVPGITVEETRRNVNIAKKNGALTMLTIGTSQEGADESTIKQIALNSKMAGADIHHIGDAGYTGIAIPENITAYSIAIRGKRHTYVRMATSALR
ncbi:haloacid dehalogenase-like hydrolase [Evansella tamaricis]|uniref:Haloacid dehalogenase-like hydrolase n=1 Tax=Evansella tamaricis TaxID=2069301 RepID=A0ABS6JGB2_9BACI|nr:haloacid dehalogenase-like hydrolase [Evansella tamaricis]MBU9711877.1 haloacid dehalogenase-like hydrolase [Evansella tamaricis]